jgi:hypothetical protein
MPLQMKDHHPSYGSRRHRTELFIQAFPFAGESSLNNQRESAHRI